MKIDSVKYPLPGRFRHHTSPNLYLPLSEIKSVPDYYPPLIDELDWKTFFFNGKPPDLLDAGCGKGSFLLDMSELYPDKNILGIELRLNVVKWLEEIIKGEKIKNCAVIWYSVANSLNFIENNSIKSIFYLFPDPWPKRKHHKRRAFNNNFLNECKRVLKSEGRLYLASDVQEVHEHHLETIQKHDGFNYRAAYNAGEWDLPLTNKEKFCALKGIETFKLICKPKI